MSDSYDYIDGINRYESGEATYDEVVTLFQYLLDSKLINSLQGSYQRQAMAFLKAGVIG